MWFEAGASPISNGTDIYRTRTYAFPLAEGYEPDENIILGKKAYCRIAGVPPADLFGGGFTKPKKSSFACFYAPPVCSCKPGILLAHKKSPPNRWAFLAL